MTAAEQLAGRIRALLAGRPEIVEKKMFGGHGFMLNGHMMVGSMKGGELLIRIDPGEEAAALGRPGAGLMHMGDRPMKGFIAVTGQGIESDEAIRDWIAYAEAYVRTLQPK